MNGYLKTQENCVVEIVWQMYKTEIAGDISLRRSRTTQGCRPDVDYDFINGINFGKKLFYT
jgi:hypothetical protein